MLLRLGIDVDGVVADFVGAFEAVAQHKLDPEIESVADPDQATLDRLTTREMKRAWHTILRTPNWWTRLEPYEPDQIRRLYAAARRHRWEVFFLTRRPQTSGEPVQFQTQWWLERHGFLLPSVVTVPGSRGELANALRLDLVVDDQMLNCVDVVSASKAHALLMHREPLDEPSSEYATSRGIGLVESLEQAIDVAERLEEVRDDEQGRLQRWTEWLTRPRRAGQTLPLDPAKRGLPPLGG